MNYVCLGELQYLTINSLGEVSRRWIELGATTLKCRQKKLWFKKREILILWLFLGCQNAVMSWFLLRNVIDKGTLRWASMLRWDQVGVKAARVEESVEGSTWRACEVDVVADPGQYARIIINKDKMHYLVDRQWMNYLCHQKWQRQKQTTKPQN